MVEPWIDSETMVGEWDPDALGWSARDWVPGPAGTVGLTLPGGVELDVDVAAPRQFVGLWVEGDGGVGVSPETAETVRTLLGHNRSQELLGLRSERPRPLRSGPADEYSRRRRWELDRGSLPNEAGLSLALSQHALAAATSTELGVSDLVRALSLIDAALAARQLRGLGFDRRARDAAEQGVAMLLDLRGELGDVDVDALAVALRSLDRVLPEPLARRARALADDLRAPRTVAASVASRVAADVAYERAAPAPVARLLDVDIATLPESLAVTTAAARMTAPSEIEVRLPSRPDLAERLWARAFDGAGSLVAAAPFLTVADDAVARLLIPPAGLRNAQLDVVDRPADLRQPASVRATVDAVHHGRTAARADRLGDRKESYSRWSRTAEAWEGVGDGERATTARRYASDGGRDGRVPPALLADAALEGA